MLTSPRLLPFLLSIPLVLPSLTGSISSSARLSLLSSGLALQQPRCAIRGFYGHTCAFAHFGGVPWRISYDNLSTAVQLMVRGKGRRENQTFVSFRSYYLFESHFCQPAAGWEKGGVVATVAFTPQIYPLPLPDALPIAPAPPTLRTA